MKTKNIQIRQNKVRIYAVTLSCHTNCLTKRIRIHIRYVMSNKTDIHHVNCTKADVRIEMVNIHHHHQVKIHVINRNVNMSLNVNIHADCT